MLAVAACCSPDGPPWEPRCTECNDPNKRQAWGCDAPTKESVTFLSPCMFCEGQSDSCTHCQGTNRMHFYRCPNKLFGSREVHAVHAASQVESGILPDAGGWNDQAHTFVLAYPLIARELQKWRDHMAEEQQRAAERAAKQRR